MYYDSNTVYFVDQQSTGIYKWEETTERFELLTPIPPQFRSNNVKFIVVNDQVLIGTTKEFYIIDTKTGAIQDLSTDLTNLVETNRFNSLSYEIRKIICLKNGDFILASERNLYRVHPKFLECKNYKETVQGKPNQSKIISTRALAVDNKGTLYLSYYNDIASRPADKKIFTHLPQTQSLSELAVSTYSLNYWNSKLLWNNAILDLRNGKYQFIGPDNKISHSNQVLDHDTLWLQIWHSNILYKINLRSNKVWSYQMGNEMVNYFNLLGDIGDLIFDESHQNFWAGTQQYGIIKISKTGKLLAFFNPEQLKISKSSTQSINFLKLSPFGLWFGCNDGLGSINLKTGQVNLYKAPEVDDNEIIHNRKFFSMIQDSLGNYYVGTDHGLLYFDTSLKDFLFLPDNHALASKEFNRQSVFHTNDGRYYFGGSDGLYSFLAHDLHFSRPTQNTAPLKISSVSIYNSKNKTTRNLEGVYDALKDIHLEYFDNQVQVECSLPDYTKEVFYSYRLLGLSDNWTQFSSQNKILLDNIPPGNYELQIHSAENLSNYNTNNYSLKIRKDNIWYNNPWIISFLILCLLAAVAYAIILVYRRKIQRMEEMAQLRIRISSDLHDNVGSILAGLAMQSQLLAYSSKEEEQKKSLHMISDLSRDAVEQMRDVVWAFDTRRDTYQGLFDKMRSAASKIFSRTGIAYDFNCESSTADTKIHTATRQAIYLIFKEALTNVLRHSNANKVRISLIHKKDSLFLLIKDNGSNPSISDKSGQGMLNMKMRADSIKGKLDIRYEEGFVVELVVGGENRK